MRLQHTTDVKIILLLVRLELVCTIWCVCTILGIKRSQSCSPPKQIPVSKCPIMRLLTCVAHCTWDINVESKPFNKFLLSNHAIPALCVCFCSGIFWCEVSINKVFWSFLSRVQKERRIPMVDIIDARASIPLKQIKQPWHARKTDDIHIGHFKMASCCSEGGASLRNTVFSESQYIHFGVYI